MTVQAGDVVRSQTGLSQLLPGDAVTDRHKVVWVKGNDSIWRSRERVPAAASSSLLIRLQVGPFRVTSVASGDTAPVGRTHGRHDDNAPVRGRRR